MNPLKLRETVECPVCYHVRRGDIYQCKKGHSVCGSCFTKLPAQLCPLARCDYDRPPRHNLMAEQIIARGGVAMDCDNADQGCLETGVGQALEEHLPECLYRKVPCPDTYCQKRIRLNKLDRHLVTSHWTPCQARFLVSKLKRRLDTSHNHRVERHFRQASSLYQTGKFSVSEKRKDWKLKMPREKKGVYFYEQMVVREGTWYAWVQVEGGAREAARWTCSVSVKGISATDQQVHPIDRTVEEVLNSGQFLALAMQQVRHLAKPNGAGSSRLLSVEYRIAEKEEEESEEEFEKDEDSEDEEESE